MRRRLFLRFFLFFFKRGDIILVSLLILGAVSFAWDKFFLAHSQIVPMSGGIYTESTVGNIRSFSPFNETSTLLEKAIRRLIFSGLLRYDTATGQVEDALAGMRISDDGKTFFLSIKDTAMFQDGTKVTTDDVIFTYEKLVQNPQFQNRSLNEAFEYVSIDVVDEKTVAFHLPEKNIFFPTLLTIPIVPKSYFKDFLMEELVDPDYPFNKHPIGGGPFRFKQIVPNDDGSFRVFLEKNQFYYAGIPKVEQIVFYVYPNFDHLKVEKNWTTAFSQIPFREISKFKEDLFGEYDTREYVLPRFVGVFFNLDNEIISDLYFRKALNFAFDKEHVLEDEKKWNRVDTPFFFEGIEGRDSLDLVEAQKVLSDLGYQFDEDDNLLLDKEGNRFTLIMITSTMPPAYSRFAQRIIQLWKKELGINIKLMILDAEKFQEALKSREYDMVLFGQDFSENFDSLSLWHSSQSDHLNLSNLTRDDVDSMIDEIRFSGIQGELLTLNKRLNDLVPAIIFATPRYNILVSNQLKGFSETFGKIHSHEDRFSGINKWYLNEKRDWNWPEDKSKIWSFIKWIFN